MWTISIALDANSNKSGTITATWSDTGIEDVIFQLRTDTNTFSAPGFKATAEAYRDEVLAKRALVAGKVTQLQDYMNGA